MSMSNISLSHDERAAFIPAKNAVEAAPIANSDIDSAVIIS
jgi:hypothetical protein